MSVLSIECRGFESHLRQLIFLWKSDLPWVCRVALPCCLFDLACYFLPSFSSLIKTIMYVDISKTTLYVNKYIHCTHKPDPWQRSGLPSAGEGREPHQVAGS